jgi:predicted RNA-binding Zn ribbon-like protein
MIIVRTIPAAPGEERSPALALVNSRHNSPSGLVDHIGCPRDALNWLTSHGLVPESADVTEDQLARLHELRQAMREVLTARLEKREPQGVAVAALNRAARGAPVVRALSWYPSSPPTAVEVHVIKDPVARAFAIIAADGMDAVCSDRAERLLQCEAPGCIRLLEQDHGRRRWCSTSCGDRVRAARYYARHRADPEQ